jgi:hypothetical protein
MGYDYHKCANCLSIVGDDHIGNLDVEILGLLTLCEECIEYMVNHELELSEPYGYYFTAIWKHHGKIVRREIYKSIGNIPLDASEYGLYQYSSWDSEAQKIFKQEPSQLNDLTSNEVRPGTYIAWLGKPYIYQTGYNYSQQDLLSYIQHCNLKDIPMFITTHMYNAEYVTGKSFPIAWFSSLEKLEAARWDKKFVLSVQQAKWRPTKVKIQQEIESCDLRIKLVKALES